MPLNLGASKGPHPPLSISLAGASEMPDFHFSLPSNNQNDREIEKKVATVAAPGKRRLGPED